MPLTLVHSTDTPQKSSITDKPALTLAWKNAVPPKKRMGFTSEEVYAQLGEHSRAILAAQAKLDAVRNAGKKPRPHLQLVRKTGNDCLLRPNRHDWYPH
jgi:hypothetical protein